MTGEDSTPQKKITDRLRCLETAPVIHELNTLFRSPLLILVAPLCFRIITAIPAFPAFPGGLSVFLDGLGWFKRFTRNSKQLPELGQKLFFRVRIVGVF